MGTGSSDHGYQGLQQHHQCNTRWVLCTRFTFTVDSTVLGQQLPLRYAS